MNAVIALCHFCELHGPRILFCTQAFHCSNHTSYEIENGVLPPTPSSCGITQSRVSSDSNSGESLSENNSEITGTPRKHSKSKQSTCQACRSLEPQDPGFISIDSESHISYISMQYPEEQELFSKVRHACVRSLSCEVCPGREGPIMFGDEASGCVFSHTFFLKDLQSRGFQRYYSIICVMMDKIYLANSWQFFVSNLKKVIDDIQGKAEALFKAEQAEKPQRDAVLQPRNAFLTPDQFRRARGGQVYRSLAEITKDVTIFETLHKSFSWILKASGLRYKEKLLEGPPLLDDLYCGDSKLSLFEEKINGSKPVVESLMHLYKLLGDEKFNLIAYHVVRGDQVIVKGDDQMTIKSLINVLTDLVPSGCVSVCWYEKEYHESWRCNFLGVDMEAEIPAYVLDSDLIVFINIKKLSGSTDEHKSYFSRCENSFEDYDFSVVGTSSDQEPTYVKSIMDALRNNTVNDKIFETMLTQFKEKWMGKVKIIFKFSKTGSKTPDEKEKLFRILDAKAEDELLLKYWMSSLCPSYRSHLLYPYQ